MDKATAHPVTAELLALSDRFATLIDHFNDAGLDSDTPEGERIFGAYWSVLERVGGGARFSRSFACRCGCEGQRREDYLPG
jgi:hypothetical protein